MVQTYYCNMKEKKSLLELQNFIKENRPVYNENITLKFIPIENETLTRYGDKTNSNLIKIILEFNSNQYYFKLKIKPFESFTDDVVDRVSLDKYIKINTFLESLNIIEHSKLLKIIEVEQFDVPLTKIKKLKKKANNYNKRNQINFLQKKSSFRHKKNKDESMHLLYIKKEKLNSKIDKVYKKQAENSNVITKYVHRCRVCFKIFNLCFVDCDNQLIDLYLKIKEKQDK